MSVTVNTHYDSTMARWEPDARGRLVQAALALYGENGYENTTVAQIAERAGLTERTFFRHFTDKREVLFGGGSALQELIVSVVADAPTRWRRSTRQRPGSRPQGSSSSSTNAAISRDSARP